MREFDIVQKAFLFFCAAMAFLALLGLLNGCTFHTIPFYHNSRTIRRVPGHPYIGYLCRNGKLTKMNLYTDINSMELVIIAELRAKEACAEEYHGKDYRARRRLIEVKTPKPSNYVSPNDYRR